jgi:glucosamine-6-phosphate deaminase
MPNPVKKFTVDKLNIKIFDSRSLSGQDAAKDIASRINELLSGRRLVRIIFAAAPSQDDVLKALALRKDIPWDRIIAFQMDEYLGIMNGARESFRYYLEQHIFSKVSPSKVYYINSKPSYPRVECTRYASLISKNRIDIIILGIGENGHIAFNDPHEADFDDPEIIKVVRLDPACRQQQVNDACFPNLGSVPRQAITLTIPALMNGKYLFCVVPGPTKALAVSRTLKEPVSADCPATILRRHDNIIMYLDRQSAQEIL